MAKLSGMRCLVRSLAVGVSIMSETESAWVSGEKKKKKSLHFPGYTLQCTICVFENPNKKDDGLFATAHCGQIG